MGGSSTDGGVGWTRMFFLSASWLIGMVFLRKRNRRRLAAHILNSKDVDLGRHFGMDMGGTLTKIVYFKPSCPSSIHLHRRLPTATSFKVSNAFKTLEEYMFSREDYGGSGRREASLVLPVPSLGGELHFIHFQSHRMTSFMSFVLQLGFHANIMTLACTGGGAHKYARDYDQQLGITLKKGDEMDCLIRGLRFVLTSAPEECYTWRNVNLSQENSTAVKHVYKHREGGVRYPFLVVNIGSGVSIIKVTSKDSYERVSGTSVGGGTYWGLCRLLSRVKTFDESMDLSLAGDNRMVDMLVGDIYGSDGYKKFDLSSSTLASSFGKMGRSTNADEEPPSEEDMARSLLVMITQNIGQVAYLNASRHETSSIFFCGNFLRHNTLASRQLAYAIDFWSKGQMQAQFFNHEGYFGAVGAFLERYYHQ